MLTHLLISNYAVAERLEIDFQPGMTVITGETGAGKSILLDALALALGDRADSASIREGAERAEIHVEFDLTHQPEVRAWLAEQELDNGEAHCLLRRTLLRDGRSRAYLNGQPVPLTLLRELGHQLIDIQGQHAHQRLLRREVQTALLDGYAMAQAEAEQVAAFCQRWRQVQTQLRAREEENAATLARRELLEFQHTELEAAQPLPGEYAQLEAEQRLLANAESILQLGHQALGALRGDDDGNLLQGLRRLRQLLADWLRQGGTLPILTELVEGAAIQLEEAATLLDRYLDELEVDEARLRAVDERLTTLHRLARKHQVPADELASLLASLDAQLQRLHSVEGETAQLQAELEQIAQGYQTAATALGDKRRQAAPRFAAAVTARLRRLSLPDARFELQLTDSASDLPRPEGQQSVEFLIVTNPGMPPRPLGKVASGGELSRIGLAVQVTAATTVATPTLVFDEVDVGIGGGVAEVVGQALHELAEHGQLLCVTHQPQVAAQADHHLQVVKQVIDGRAATRLVELDREARTQEVARMLGGTQISARALEHARELVARGAQSSRAAES